MKISRFMKAFQSDYFNFGIANRFHSRMKLNSVLYAKQKSRSQFDLDDEDMMGERVSGETVYVMDSNCSIERKLLSEVLAERRSSLFREMNSDWTKFDLFSLLHHALGVTAAKEIVFFPTPGESYNYVLNHRAYPSGGGIYPIEHYIYSRGIDGIEDGLYRFHPDSSVLSREADPIDDHQLEAFFPMTTYKDDVNTESLYQVKALMFMVSNYKHSSQKYGLLAYKLALLEAGHIGQNIQLCATALSKKTALLCGYYEDTVERFLGLDPAHKNCLYIIALG
ncbi:hypothetical protein DNH61_25230 [Paenibacillus sambharensis]|uniref:Nitroreductase domain-containing protein n=1 Tax=Paenibacillus sambharensis TaxID=1803190 RepID=A0A2W1LDE8_9BACL|nr:SagB family peptide dehydrogenase [Paenibacillus sambharensis]PZD93085.1 hypothetical protein DNH61_25230 [Paenibacillus sambharensis]